MDDTTREMLISAYIETVDEAMSNGLDSAKAHEEGITAASMLLAATNGMEDEEARGAVEAIGLSPDIE